MLRPETAALIGGRWAVSLRMFVIAVPVLLASQVMFLAPGTAAGSLPTVLLQGIAGVVAVGAVLGLADLTVLRGRTVRPVPVAVVVAVGAMAGAVRALTGTAFTSLLTGTDAAVSTTVGRTISAALAGAVLLPLGAWSFASIDRFRHERAALVASLSSTRQRAGESLATAAALQGLVHEAARARVQVVTDDVLQQVATRPDDDAHAAATLIAAIDERIRPLSHDLWSSQPPTPRMRWSTAVRAALRSGAPPALPVLSLLLAIMAPRELTTRDLPDALTVMGLCLLWVAGALVVLRRLPPRWRGWTSTIVALTSASAFIAVTASLALGVALAAAAPGALAVLVASATLTIVSSIVIAATREADVVLDHLRTSIDEAEVTRRMADELRTEAESAAAGVIHAQVQGTLLVAATTLARGDRTAHEPWLTDLLRALPNSLQSVASETAHVADVRDAWSDLLDVTVTFPDEFPDALEPQVALIAREGIANCFRHGQATWARVEVVKDPDGWEVRIEADGLAPLPNPTRGLGLSRVERISSAWTLASTPAGGSRLVVPLPTPPES